MVKYAFELFNNPMHILCEFTILLTPSTNRKIFHKKYILLFITILYVLNCYCFERFNGLRKKKSLHHVTEFHHFQRTLIIQRRVYTKTVSNSTYKQNLEIFIIDMNFLLRDPLEICQQNTNQNSTIKKNIVNSTVKI